MIRDATPTFKWNRAEDPPFDADVGNLSYSLELASGTADFSNVVFTQAGIVDEDLSTPNVVEFTKPQPDLAVGGYIWRVRAKDRANNTGDFSTPLTFTVGEAVDLRLVAGARAGPRRRRG